MKEIGVCLCKRMDRKSGIKHNYNSFIGEDEITSNNCKKKDKPKSDYSVFSQIFCMKCIKRNLPPLVFVYNF